MKYYQINYVIIKLSENKTTKGGGSLKGLCLIMGEGGWT